MKLKIFLSALLAVGFNKCFGMEKFMTNAYHGCNLRLQTQYTQAWAGYYGSKEKSLFDYAVKNNMTLVVKDILDKYDALQETGEQAVKQIGERSQLCWRLFYTLVLDQNHSEASQLVCDTLKNDMRKLKGLKSGLTPESEAAVQELFTYVVKKGQLTSVKMLIDSGLVTIDQHEKEWAEDKRDRGHYLAHIALMYKHPEIADYLFKKGLDKCTIDQKKLDPLTLVPVDIIRLKGGNAIICDPKMLDEGTRKDKFKEKRLYYFIVSAVQNKYCPLASQWVDQMAQKNKWQPNKYPQFYENSNKASMLLERYGVDYLHMSGKFNEKTIFKEKLKTLTFLAQFSKKMNFDYICDDKKYRDDEKRIDKEILLNENNVKYALALGWAFNCRNFNLNCSSLSNYGINISKDELDQLVIDNAQEIGLPGLKTVDDVKKYRALMLKFKTEKLDAIRDEAITNNKYPIDWEGEFAKFKTTEINANRIDNLIKNNSSNTQINYLISLKRDKLQKS